jgi:hypothetical protein
MSGISERDPLDLRAVLAKIDRDRAETEKLFAEARKFNRDPWFLIFGAIIAALATRLPEILRALGLPQ